jgi:hypothetical protein
MILYKGHQLGNFQGATHCGDLYFRDSGANTAINSACVSISVCSKEKVVAGFWHDQEVAKQLKRSSIETLQWSISSFRGMKERQKRFKVFAAHLIATLPRYVGRIEEVKMHGHTSCV